MAALIRLWKNLHFCAQALQCSLGVKRKEPDQKVSHFLLGDGLTWAAKPKVNPSL